MFAYIYQWVENLAFYLVLTTAVIQVLPNTSYKKYIRFFTGLLLVLLLMTPLLKVAGMEKRFQDIYNNKQYEQEVKKIEAATTYLEGVDRNDYIPGEYMEEDQASQ